MGVIVDSKKIENTHYYRLVMFTKINDDKGQLAYSINKRLAEELIKIKPERRTMYLERCLFGIIESLPDNSIIKDIDVIFNPQYEIDVMQLLISLYKKKEFSVIWPGYLEGNRLVYSEEIYSDYVTFAVEDYDIVCVV